MTPETEAAILKLGRDRYLAHQALFGHRHPDKTPPFHRDLIDMWHSRDPYGLAMVFREGGKSTIAEESFVIGAGYQLFHNAMIIGSTEKRACERLRAIKHEIEHNELVSVLFGDLVGDTWNEAEVIMSNGVRIIALGRGQSLRGTKHLHFRPDFCFCDDIEEEENVKDADAREETLSWFMRVVVPAMDKWGRIRVNATPLDREALPFALQRRLGWKTLTIPIEYVDEHGDRRPTWPSRYPLEWIDKKRRDFEAVGKLDDYMREYMCVADDPKRKSFTADMFKVEPRVRTWHPTYAFIDPARTTKQTSALTGWAVWSWIGNRLIVWDGGGGLWKPDEIVSHIFKLDEDYRCLSIGVEETGLNEFLLQPIRHEMLRRGALVPVRPMNAPRDKMRFIEALQPFFVGGEITFAKDLAELRAQFLNFPSGRIDGPNALAYALLMRAGQAVYGEFCGDHVAIDVRLRRDEPAHLCLGARNGVTTAALCQYSHGTLRIARDWVREGEPTATVESIVKEARLVQQNLRLLATGDHWSGFNHLGLRGAVAKIPDELQRGAAPEMGRNELRELLRQRTGDIARLQVSIDARWVINGFAAGYCYGIGRNGALTSQPTDDHYRTLMESIESLAGLLKAGLTDTPNYARTAGGQLYVSALPGQRGVTDAKDSFLNPGNVTDAGALSALPTRH